MIVIELLYNLFALLSLSVVSNFIDQKYDRRTLKGKILQGLLFGAISSIGMMNPFVFEKGIIFDGRSITISLSTLFFGPLTGFIATAMSFLYRWYLGGGGMIMGFFVIITSFLWGFLFYSLSQNKKFQITNLNLYLFGLVVTITMSLAAILLPGGRFVDFLRKVAPTVIIFYPIITVGIGRIIYNQLSSNDSLQALRESETELKTTLYSIGDAIIITDKKGIILRMNFEAENLTGWKESEAVGKPLTDVFVIRNEFTREPINSPVDIALEKGLSTNLANHTILLSRDGRELPIMDSAAPIKVKNDIVGVVLVFRDQTEERKKLRQLEEKERFQSFLIANLPGFVYRCAYDKNWTMFYISEGCKELTGYAPEEFIADKPVFNDIIHPDYHQILYDEWEKVLRERRVFEYSYPIITKSGEIKWVYERGRGIFSDSGEVLYLEGFITDITNERKYLEQLQENEKKFRIVSNIISDYLFSSVIEKNGNTYIEWVAGAFKEITGYSFDEYVSIGGWRSRLHPDDFETDEQAYKKLLQNHDVINEVRTFHKTGKIVWLRVYAHPVWDEKEKRVTAIVGAVQDITQEKRAELISQIEIKVADAIIKYQTETELFELIRLQLAQIVEVKNFFVAFYNKDTGLLRSAVESDEKDDIPVWRAKGSLTGYLIEQNRTLCLSKNDIIKLTSENKFSLIGTLPEQWIGVPLNVGGEVVGAVVIQDYNNPNAYDEQIIRIMENIAGFLSLFLERQRREEQLKESEERFRNLFENQEAILLLMDAESGMIIDANKSAQRFYMYSLDELKEKTIFDIDIAPPDVIKKSMIQIYKRVQSRFETKHKLADGSLRDVEIYTSLIAISNHKFFYSIVFDITEKKRAEKEVQLLKTAILQNPTIIIITNTNGEVEFVNPKFTESTQYTLEEVKGNTLRILKSGLHGEDFYRELWDTIKNGKTWHGEILNKRKDGTLFWVDSIISPIMDSNGRISHFVAVQEDVTLRKKMLESLIKSEEEFRSIWENSVDAMRLVNEDGIVVNVNQAYCDLFKVSRVNLVGKPFNAAFVIRDQDKSLDSYKQRFRLRTIRKKFETEILLHDGSLIWVELTNAFIEIKDSPTLLLSIFRDITNYKKLIAETVEAKEKAEEMNKVKSYFFANMSHELRTPLVGILGFADILREELEERPDLCKMAELITKSGERLNETLNLILSLSKLEAGKIEVKLTEENIVPHLKTSFNLFESAAAKKNLEYKLELPNQEVVCRFDPNLIQNVLNNLINNAIKFTSQGTVTIKLDTVGDKARIQVIDTGIGIPKENQSVIWEEFRQVSEGLNRSFEGTGLGLTIVKRFTTLMGGEVHLESEKDKGSNFIVELPLIDKQLVQELKEASKRREQCSDVNAPASSFDLLYVEDDQSSVDIVSLMLKNKYIIDIARTPEDALNKVKQNTYKALLLDINLTTEIDGVQLCSMIRQLNGYEKIPIAAITAYALEKDKENFLSNGMTHYLQKPFSKNELLSLLDEMLNQ
jgi:PAS domain S-box-containing protein